MTQIVNVPSRATGGYSEDVRLAMLLGCPSPFRDFGHHVAIGGAVAERIGQTTQRSWDYDDNGNQLHRYIPGGATTTFTYDWQNQLVGISGGGQSSKTFAYDGLGRRVFRQVGSATPTTYYFDGGNVQNERVGTGSWTSYRYGVGLIRRNSEYPLFDGQGNTHQITNTSQNVSASFVYDAFGNTTSSSGSTSVDNHYCGNWGYQDDGDAGLMHVGARWYDPSVGRFTTRDRDVVDEPYVYCSADPVDLGDSSGCSGFPIAIAPDMRLAGPNGEWYSPPVDDAGAIHWKQDWKLANEIHSYGGGTTSAAECYGMYFVVSVNGALAQRDRIASDKGLLNGKSSTQGTLGDVRATQGGSPNGSRIKLTVPGWKDGGTGANE